VTLLARLWWLTPVILATQGADIRRIEVGSQPRQIVHKPVLKNSITKKSWWSGSSRPKFKPWHWRGKKKRMTLRSGESRFEARPNK
jgi:hypothetical protein